MKRTAAVVKLPDASPLDRESAELGEECACVLLLLLQLAKARATRVDASAILGELSATVLHLNAHTRRLDEAIDELAGGEAPSNQNRLVAAAPNFRCGRR